MQKEFQFQTSDTLAEIKTMYKSKVDPENLPTITKSEQVYKYLMNSKAFDPDTIEYREEFVLVILNRKNRALGYVKLSQGGTAGTVVDEKMIFSIALKYNVSSIILAHNHPSGSLKPSPADISLTKKIEKGGTLLGISVLDHLIVSKNDFLSMADEGFFS